MFNLLNFLIIFIAKYFIFLVLGLAVWFFFQLSSLERKRLFILTIITLPLIYIVAKFLSLAYYDPRPFITNHIIPLFPHNPDNGFPSDHVLLSGAIATVIFYFNKKIGIFFFAMAILIGVARVLAGVHHSLDIFGSLIIAIVVSYLTYKFIFSRFNKKIDNFVWPQINKKR